MCLRMWTHCRRIIYHGELTGCVTLSLPRYEAKTNELINEELGIAYPIVDGIPNMIPQEARLLQKDAGTPSTPQQE